MIFPSNRMQASAPRFRRDKSYSRVRRVKSQHSCSSFHLQTYVIISRTTKNSRRSHEHSHHFLQKYCARLRFPCLHSFFYSSWAQHARGLNFNNFKIQPYSFFVLVCARSFVSQAMGYYYYSLIVNILIYASIYSRKNNLRRNFISKADIYM